jgi:hypothetical protein
MTAQGISRYSIFAIGHFKIQGMLVWVCTLAKKSFDLGKTLAATITGDADSWELP